MWTTGSAPDRLLAALRDAVGGHRDWLRAEHRVGDPARYMRHLLYVDPGDRFVITAITWLPGQKSPVHGHYVWCAYGVAEGELTEETFRARHAARGARHQDHPRRRARRAGPRRPDLPPRVQPHGETAGHAARLRRRLLQPHHRHQPHLRRMNDWRVTGGWWRRGCSSAPRFTFAMVVVGGITRLTESGLSIVEWQPLAGALPPLSQADWEALFAKYQATPQYPEGVFRNRAGRLQAHLLVGIRAPAARAGDRAGFSLALSVFSDQGKTGQAPCLETRRAVRAGRRCRARWAGTWCRAAWWTTRASATSASPRTWAWPC